MNLNHPLLTSKDFAKTALFGVSPFLALLTSLKYLKNLNNTQKDPSLKPRMKSKKKVIPKHSLIMKRKLVDIDTNLGNEPPVEGRPVTQKVQIQHPHTTKS